MNPRKELLSLAQIMYEYKIGDLALTLTGLLSACRDLDTADQLQQAICDDAFMEDLVQCVDALATVAANFHADSSLAEQIKTFHKELSNGSAGRREAVLYARLRAILEGVQDNLNSRRFMFVPADQAGYWNNPELFGDEFLFTFPTAAQLESCEAGNCYVSARWTACVFHCMRVAEYGLRKLAKRLHVVLTHKGKNCPIEYADWDKAITGIKNKITAIRQIPHGAKRADDLAMYSSLADCCEYMKDIWRNETSHARRRYKKSEALGVMNRVRDFVQLIGKKDVKRAMAKRKKKFLQRQAQQQSSIMTFNKLMQLRTPPEGSNEP